MKPPSRAELIRRLKVRMASDTAILCDLSAESGNTPGTDADPGLTDAMYEAMTVEQLQAALALEPLKRES